MRASIQYITDSDEVLMRSNIQIKSLIDITPAVVNTIQELPDQVNDWVRIEIEIHRENT